MFTFTQTTGKIAGLTTLVLMFFVLATSNQAKACDRSSFTLDNIVNVGPEFEVNATLRIGAGILGSSRGGGNNTYSFGFGFFSCLDNLPITYFTPTVTSDTTQVTGFGVNVGPGFFGTQGFIFYNVPGNYTCVTNTAYCGQTHTEITNVTFRMPFLPDSIRAYGIEGTGNPFAGCYPDADMTIHFGGMAYSCPSVAAPQTGDVYANMPESIRQNMPEFLTYGYNPAAGAGEVEDHHGVTTSIEGATQIDLQVYPNPNNGHFRVRAEGLTGKAEIVIYNLTGQQMGRQTLNAGNQQAELNLDHLTPGMYMARIESDQGNVVRKFNVVK